MGKKKKYAIGVDLGGTKILVGLVDESYRVLAHVKAKTKPQKGESYFLSTLHDAIWQVMEDAKIDHKELAGIGAGCPGIIDAKRGVVLLSPNIPFLKGYPLAAKIGKRFRTPVVLGNDVKTGVFGEHQLGAARGHDNVIGVFLGTGIGGAIIAQGQLVLGASGGAGEIGHTLVDPLGPVCGCGRRGCLEAMASRTAMAIEGAGLVIRQKAPKLLELSHGAIAEIKSSVLAKAIAGGDTAVEEMVRSKARMVGTVLANLVNLLNPSIIVMGGGVVEAMPRLIVKEVDEAMRAHAMPSLAKAVKVVAAKFGDYSIVMGAAKKAFDASGNIRQPATGSRQPSTKLTNQSE